MGFATFYLYGVTAHCSESADLSRILVVLWIVPIRERRDRFIGAERAYYLKIVGRGYLAPADSLALGVLAVPLSLSRFCIPTHLVGCRVRR